MSAPKRALDIALGLPATLLVTPVMAALAVAVLATSGWPPLIRQTRVGADERSIVIWKFRTMKRNTPIMAKAALLGVGRSASDIFTPLGPWMRRLSLDELPQLYSVVVGDMSLVGPRPALPSQEDLLKLRRRHSVTHLKPGLTGLAQIRGREALTLPTKVRFEAIYGRQLSVGYDLAIIARTVRVLLSKRGAY